MYTIIHYFVATLLIKDQHNYSGAVQRQGKQAILSLTRDLGLEHFYQRFSYWQEVKGLAGYTLHWVLTILRGQTGQTLKPWWYNFRERHGQATAKVCRNCPLKLRPSQDAHRIARSSSTNDLSHCIKYKAKFTNYCRGGQIEVQTSQTRFRIQLPPMCSFFRCSGGTGIPSRVSSK